MVEKNMEINNEAVLVKYSGQDEVVTVPEGVKKIGAWAFRSNEFIKEVILPQSVTEIGDSAFERSSLNRIVISARVDRMGYSVFKYCYQLKNIILPDNLEYIDMNTFQGCENLKELVLPSKLKKIDGAAFENCGIIELRIPDSMIYVNKNSFRYMGCLERLFLPSTLKRIGEGAFSFCGKLKEVCIPEGVIEIERSAFDACTNLEKVVLPKSLISMDKSAFSRTKVSDSEYLKDVYNRIDNVKIYKKPVGYQEMTFHEMKLYYSSESTNLGKFGFARSIDDFSYEYDITESLKVFKDKNGRKALMIYVSVPTFDSGDREWDSYRKLFLIPVKGKITGVMVCGGYKIAKILTYKDILCADEKTEKLLKSTNIF